MWYSDHISGWYYIELATGRSRVEGYIVGDKRKAAASFTLKRAMAVSNQIIYDDMNNDFPRPIVKIHNVKTKEEIPLSAL